MSLGKARQARQDDPDREGRRHRDPQRSLQFSCAARGVAQAASDLMEQGSPAFEAAIPILSQLLKAETAEREVRSVGYQIKAARFPVYKDLTGFDFASS